MKALLLSNQSRSMAIFWRALIGAMQKRGMDVVCCAPPGDSASDAALAGMGARVIHYRLDRKGLNPLADLRTLRELREILAAEKPDILFATTIKPVIYGCMAAASAGVKGIFATITGLGYAFEADNPFKKLINRISRALYRKALKNAKGVFFQNQADAQVFREQGILGPGSPVLFAAGTGVDTERFYQAPFPQSPAPVFLLVSRLLEAKGIADYAAAAKLLKQKYPAARFQILGPPESGPGAFSKERLLALQAEGAIEYLGETNDIRPYLAVAHVAVLPSWREGLSTFLMEAMSMGRPLVASAVPGCAELVKDGENGFLAHAKDPVALAAAMEKFIVKPDLIAKMGAASREIAVASLDADVVADGILNEIAGRLA